ncbi:MAG: DUF2007 domain-containing protein [Muribaculaceae bacterium]|nr:DUF2007 domain-containing protein [Muribaculaceae bacterium]
MNEPVIIRTFDNSFAANVAKTKLEAYGIKAILNNAIMSGVWAIPSASFDTISLLVNPADVAEAEKILADTE